MLDAGADVGQNDHFGDTALDVSLYKGHSKLAVLLLENDASWPPQKLLQMALCAAVLWGSKDLVKKLVADGADPSKKDQYGQSPYHLAKEADNEETAKMILLLCEECAREEGSDR